MKLVLKGNGESTAEVLIVGVFQNDSNEDAKTAVKKRATKDVSAVFSVKNEGESKKKTLIFGVKKHVLLYGLGKRADCTLQKMREMASDAANHCKNQGYKHIAFKVQFGLPNTLAAMVEGAGLGTYEFHAYHSKKSEKKLSTIEFLVDNPKKDKKEFDRAVHITESQNNIRDLGNEPSNIATPIFLANHAKKIAKKWGLKCTIWDEKKIKKMKMGGLIAVGKGSNHPPRFIILEHKGKKGADTVAVVGKGITFDAGGISIKPSSAMDEMKFDMCGAAATLGVMEAVARTKCDLNVLGIVPTCENMPSSTAYKPGDVITTMSGKTIEILNTDAEGRVILSDGLHYATTRKPKVIFDMATLTGACVVALGSHNCAVMTNTQEYADKLLAASKSCGEKAWQLPLTDEYRAEVKSDIADVKNMGKGRESGSIAAACLLETFVNKTPWVHLDIAGVAWTTSPRAEFGKGATGFGVRLLLETFRQWK